MRQDDGGNWIWVTQDGSEVYVDEMTNQHLEGAVRMLARAGRGGSKPSTILLAEAMRRGLTIRVEDEEANARIRQALLRAAKPISKRPAAGDIYTAPIEDQELLVRAAEEFWASDAVQASVKRFSEVGYLSDLQRICLRRLLEAAAQRRLRKAQREKEKG